MTLEEMGAAFEAASESSRINAFDALPGKRSAWRDVHAFLLLAEILPRDKAHKMIACVGGFRWGV